MNPVKFFSAILFCAISVILSSCSNMSGNDHRPTASIPGALAVARFFGLVIGLCSLLLSGCATLSPLSISESSLEGYFREQVAKYDNEQLKSGSLLSVGLQNVDITLGPDGRDVMLLDVAGEVAVNALLTQLPVDVSLIVEGSPVYKSEEKAIYVKRLKLIESAVDTPFFNRDVAPLTDNVMRVVAQLLETIPVYRLDDAHWAGNLLAIADMDLKVAPGKLVFVPSQ